jgi:ribosome-associated protein
MTNPQALEHTRTLVQTAARICEEKKGQDTRILELDPIDSGLADFFLITSALNDRQAVAIADDIEITLKRDYGVMPTSVEGRRRGDWVLLDYVDFVVHVFLTERRAFYDIERLRKSARPLTPAEFDEELKAALTAKTRAARGKTAVPSEKSSSQAQKTSPAAKPKKAANRSAAGAKPAPVAKAPAKSPAKKAAPKKSAAKKSSTKK